MKKINIISLFLLAILTVFVFFSWFVSPIIAYGDNWYYFKSMYDNHFIYPYAWYKLAGIGGLGIQGYPFIHTNIIVAFLLSFAKSFGLMWQDSLRFFLYGGFLISSLSISIYVSKKLLPNNIFWIISPIIFILNTYILMALSGGLVIIGLAYSLIPLIIYLFIQILDNPNLKIKENLSNILGVSIVLAAQTFLDIRVAIITSFAVLIYLLISLFLDFEYKKLSNFVIPFSIVFLINLYWIIPVFVGGSNPVGQLGSDYTSTEILEFLSFAKLENTVSLLHPYWPENIFGKISFLNPIYLILPIIAFASLLFVRKNNKNSKLVIYFAVIGLTGIFLAKGANYPFGNVYIWLFENVPGFQLFRDSFKWYMLIIVSYMFLIPLALNETSEFIKKKFSFKHINFIILGIFLFFFLVSIKPALIGDLPGTFQQRDIPKSYAQLNDYLSKDDLFFRTLWVPNTMLFSHYTNQHPIISARDFYKEFDLAALATEIASESSQLLLNEVSVKYVIVAEDSEEQIYLTDRKYDESRYLEVVDILDESRYLQKEKEIGKVVVYRTPDYKEQFWSENDAEVGYEFINPTKYTVSVSDFSAGDKLIFSESYDPGWIAVVDGEEIESMQFNDKFNSFSLPEGSYKFEVVYKYQKYVDIGLVLSLLSLTTVLLILIIVLTNKKLKK